MRQGTLPGMGILSWNVKRSGLACVALPQLTDHCQGQQVGAIWDRQPVPGLCRSGQVAGVEPTAWLSPLGPQPDHRRGWLPHLSEPICPREGEQREDTPGGDCLPALPGAPGSAS